MSLLTALVMLGAAEVLARLQWAEHPETQCVVQDRLLVAHALPNCTASTKMAEGDWVSYHFNECGYRTFDSCGVKPAGTIRIVTLGSSIVEGAGVPFDQTFTERIAKAVHHTTARNVQLENLGLVSLSPFFTYARLSEAIALRPDIVIYTVAPFDVAEPLSRAELARLDNRLPLDDNPSARRGVPLLKQAQNTLKNSRAFLVAQHFLFSNSDTVLRVSLAYGEKNAYLLQPTDPVWQAHYQDFHLILSKMADKLRRAGIPMILVAAPSREIAALLDVNQRPPHSDPFAFSRTLQAMASELNIGYVDAIQEFAQTPHSFALFYPVDLHPNADGHALLARAVVHKSLDRILTSVAAMAKN